MNVPDGLSFFIRNMRALRVNANPSTTGTCDSCGRSDIGVVGQTPTCMDCYPIRRCYNGNVRLGTGTYVVIDEKRVRVWASGLTQADFDPSVTVHQGGSGVEGDVLREIVMTPPKPPYLFMVFQKKGGFATDLKVNYDPDHVVMSLFPMTSGSAIFDSFDSGLIRSLLKVSGTPLTAAEWSETIKIRHHVGSLSVDEADKRKALRERFGHLYADIPRPNSAEHHILRKLSKG